MTNLEEVVTHLTNTNQEQNRIIVQQREKIQLLEPQVKQLTQQYQFFKQTVQQYMPTTQTPIDQAQISTLNPNIL